MALDTPTRRSQRWPPPPAGRVVDCAEHRTLLWREADGLLLKTLADDLLAPLLEKTIHRRIQLAQTLARWLEFNESAAVLGGALGVHPHTVYNRLHELHDMFGDRLDDPDDRLAMRACLGSALPEWQEERRLRGRSTKSKARLEKQTGS